MARILIGNIKGPKGDTGAQGPQGATGPQGPQGPLPPLVNNALATEAGVAALDAAMGKTLQEQITNNKNDITELNSNMQETSEDVNLLTYGLAPDQNDLLNWANDDGRRRQIWKITENGMTGTPDDSREWCCLNFQDNSKNRGIVIAFLYGQSTVKFRSYFQGSWHSDWVTLHD